MNSDPQALCASYLDGTLSPEERDRLVELLKSDPALRAELRSQLIVSGALARMRPELSDETFLRNALPHLKAVGGEDEEIFPDRVMNVIRIRRTRRTFYAIAAAVAMLGAVAALLPIKRAAAGGTITATLYSADDAGSSRPVRTGETLEFSNGVSRLEFSNGAVVAVEAPASLSVRSVEEVVLRHGRLNAWCPETAHGFRVVTNSATLIDRGTSFGVSAAMDGTADFVVLDGKVEVEKDGETRTLLKGGALRANRKNKGLRDLAFEPSPYQRTWPVASGIRTTKGEVVPAPPGTPETLAGMESDTHILVIPERRDFRLASRIRVDIDAPGTYQAESLLANLPFKPRQNVRMRSYLLRYNPVGSVPKPGFRRFEGSVTFDRPVLAIIVGGKKLHQTDERLSKAPLPTLNAIDAELRGLERAKNPGADSVTLSEDRRTVSVIFYAGESIDEIRAITADD
ncbi:MAG: hypothetical protein EOP88_05395 [Verrucomicrobiaceae bacterium]|nr:MAG: hypothetical protein EOP88_05395 [Verrucomicrobiaceae bacterium]